MSMEKFTATIFRLTRNIHPVGARRTDAEPLALKLQREHDADIGALFKQASNAYSAKHAR